MLIRLRVHTHELDEIISFDLHDALIFELSKVNVNVQEVIPANKQKAKKVSPANKDRQRKLALQNKSNKH